MNCLLCLETNNDKNKYLQLDSKNGKALNILEIIEKHFWLKINLETQNKICESCWEIVYHFHEFYLRIEKSHNKLNEISEEIFESSDNDEVFRRRRGRPRKAKLEAIIKIPKKRGRKKKTENNDTTLEEKNKSIDSNKSNDDTLLFNQNEVENVIVKCELMNLDLDEKSFKIEDQKDIFDGVENSHLGGTQDEITIKAESISENSLSAMDPIVEDRKNSFDTEEEEEEEKGKEEIVLKKKNSESNDKTKPLSKSKEIDEFISANFKLHCFICDQLLSNFANLKKHFRTEHKMRGYALCCGKKLLKRCVLEDHIHVHIDPKYFKCPRCDKAMSDRRSLELHEVLHVEGKDRKFECPTCKKTFFRQSIFQRHKLLHLPQEQKQIQCLKCDKRFATKYIMNQHLKLVHLKSYAKMCDVCGKLIRGRAAMDRHMEEHLGLPRPTIQCELCGITLTNKYGLARHLKVRHTAEYLTPQTCPTCGKISPNKSAHDRHMKYMHDMERKHLCPMCTKAFKRAKELRVNRNVNQF